MEDSFEFPDGKQFQTPQGPLLADICTSQGALHTGTLFSQGTVAWIPTKSTLVHHR